MHIRRRTISWLVAAVAWSCGGSIAGVDAAPGNDVAAIDIVPASFTLVIGSEAPFQAAVHDAAGQLLPNVPVVWSVKDTTIARISSSGVVSARSVGNTQIAASANGISAIATVTVQLPPVVSVLVLPLTQTLVLGQTATFTATPRDVNGAPLSGRVVTWTSDNEGVATVAQNGVVTSRAVGSATITVASEGVSGSATVMVTPVPVGSVTVLPTTASVTTGQNVKLAATVSDTAGRVVTDRVVTWASSDPHVAVVSATGVVTGVAPGTVSISAASEEKTGSATVTVQAISVPVASVALQPTSVSLAPGETAPLQATTKSSSGTVLTGRVVTFSSNNTGVARVSSDGVVTAIAPGTAVITATSEGRSATATVTVTTPVAKVIVSPGTVFLRKGSTVQLSAKAYDAANHELGGRAASWTSSNATIATVSATGLVTAKKTGTVTITATIEGKADTTSVIVTN